MRSLAAVLICWSLAAALAPSRSAPALDYEFFKAKVEPIFLEKRPGHTRCYVCHSESSNAFRLEKIPNGMSFFTEEQTRHNFESASALVVPGDPDRSRLLLHPLAPEAGGDAYHSGGRQFASKTDPEFRTIAEWISGARLRGGNR